MRVLIHEWVTGGGFAGAPLPVGWTREGLAIRRALAGDFAAVPGVRVVATLDERFTDGPEPWETVSVAPGREVESLHALASTCDFTLLVAPETGGTLLDRMRQLAGHAGLGSEPEGIALAGDKLALAAFLSRVGIATPPSRAFPTEAGPPTDCAYPAVAKPCDGAGAEFTYRLEGPGDFRAEAGMPATMLIQPFVAGRSYSASFLADGAGGAHLLGVGRQCVTLQGTTLSYDGGLLPVSASLAGEEPARAVRAVPGLRGFVGVDFVRDEATGRVTVIEINPRPTTSYVGLRRFWGDGVIAGAWLDLARGREVRLGGPPVPAHPWRFFPDGSITASESDG